MFRASLISLVRKQLPDLPSSDSAFSADSLGQAISNLGKGVTSAGKLLLNGEWAELGTRIVDGVLKMGGELAPKLLSALVVSAVFYGLYRIVLRLSSQFMERHRKVDEGMQAIGIKTLRALGLGFVAVVGLAQLGVNVSAILAGFGIAGLALGFAAKDALGNFISGVTILLDRPFKVGDWVQVGGMYGQVRELTLRSTRILTRNRELIVIPNDHMVNQPVHNQSANRVFRVDVEFGVSYKEDVAHVREVVLALVQDDGRLATDPEPAVVMTKMNDSSVDFQLRFWLKDAGLSLPMRWEYTEKIRKALAAESIEIPFPHLQLHVDGAKGIADLPAFQAVQGKE